MPRPPETPDVKASKALAYILRHGAEKEGLYMRQDGFIRLSDVLARPKLREVDLEMVLRLVSENAKQRFELLYGYDPSPPRPPKIKKGQQPKKVRQISQPEIVSLAQGSSTETKRTGEMDAAKVEDLAKNLGSTSLTPVEMPLVTLPDPARTIAVEHADQSKTENMGETKDTTGKKGEYFIRATQGHSIKLESTAHLEPVLSDEDGLSRAGVCVHGTKWELWDVLTKEGLSRMTRTHIHLAPALSDHQILPRPNSTLRIYLDVPRLLEARIPLYTSLNGVVLTPGDDQGKVNVTYWKKAERKIKGEWVTVLEEGKTTDVALRTSTES